MTTLTEAVDRLYGSLPERDDQDRGSVAVKTDDIRVVTEALFMYRLAAAAQEDEES